jgi:hypothetical protein
MKENCYFDYCYTITKESFSISRNYSLLFLDDLDERIRKTSKSVSPCAVIQSFRGVRISEHGAIEKTVCAGVLRERTAVRCVASVDPGQYVPSGPDTTS